MTPSRTLRRRLVLLAAAIPLLSTPVRAASQPSVLSINACTDQLLITLADPNQILGVTRYARDPKQSPLAEQAARLPVVSGTAEEILALRPDLVLSGSFTRRATRDFVEARGTSVVEFDTPRTLNEAKAQIVEVARLVGHPDRADAIVRAIDDAVERARASSGKQGGTVLAVGRRGWVTGPNTMTHSLIEMLGLRDAGTTLDSGIGRQAGLEEIIALRPDYLLVAGTAEAWDQGSALLQHPSLTALYPRGRRIAAPDSLAFCAGPVLARIINTLADEIARLRH